MALLQTCYCCSSLKQMVLVGGWYTLIFSFVDAFDFVLTLFYGEEWAILAEGDDDDPHHYDPDGRGILRQREHKNASQQDPHKVVRNLVQGSMINPKGFDTQDMLSLGFIELTCNVCVVISCLMLFIGLCQRKRALLLPWIVFSSVQAAISLCMGGYLLGLKTTQFEPITAFIFTVHFFLISAHAYVILGGISLYQENFRPSQSEQRLVEMGMPATGHILRKRSAPSKLQSAAKPKSGGGGGGDQSDPKSPQDDEGIKVEEETSKVLTSQHSPVSFEGENSRGSLCRSNRRCKSLVVMRLGAKCKPLEVIHELSSDRSTTARATLTGNEGELSKEQCQMLINSALQKHVVVDQMTESVGQECFQLKVLASRRPESQQEAAEEDQLLLVRRHCNTVLDDEEEERHQHSSSSDSGCISSSEKVTVKEEENQKSSSQVSPSSSASQSEKTPAPVEQNQAIGSGGGSLSQPLEDESLHHNPNPIKTLWPRAKHVLHALKVYGSKEEGQGENEDEEEEFAEDVW